MRRYFLGGGYGIIEMNDRRLICYLLLVVGYIFDDFFCGFL